MSHDFTTMNDQLFADRELTASLEGRWLIKPARRCLKQDIPFLASLYYNDETKKIVKRLVANRMINLNRQIYFPEFQPWFRHKGELKFVGSYFEAQKTYLVTQVRGFSLPDMPIIDDLSPREEIDPEEVGGEKTGPLVRQLEEPELDINSDERPDTTAGVATIIADPIKVKNQPIIVRAAEPEKKPKKTPDDIVDKPVKEVSTDEEEGSGKGVGSGTVRHGEGADFMATLIALWKSLLWYAERYPKKLVSVNFYTKLNGRCNESRLHLQSLWNHDEKPESKWFFLKERNRYRGMMIIELVLEDNRRVIVFSLERQIKLRYDEFVEVDSFKGLMCSLAPNATLSVLVDKVIESFEPGIINFEIDNYQKLLFNYEFFKHQPCKFYDEKTKTQVRFKTLIDRFIRFGLECPSKKD